MSELQTHVGLFSFLNFIYSMKFGTCKYLNSLIPMPSLKFACELCVFFQLLFVARRQINF